MLSVLMSSVGISEAHLSMAVLSICFALVFAALFGAPLARVAETFEHQVFHALNNPSVLKNAQQHLGEQLLPHLHSLHWGFHLGQTVIDMRVVTSILVALAIATLTSVGQSLAEQVS